ncbi:hypothetical protein FB451DRAFT_268496 [Mycena latifolia]|nr:hypothetical protein FB451DRAFT_268496 [Mycena latifolia]
MVSYTARPADLVLTIFALPRRFAVLPHRNCVTEPTDALRNPGKILVKLKLCAVMINGHGSQAMLWALLNSKGTTCKVIYHAYLCGRVYDVSPRDSNYSAMIYHLATTCAIGFKLHSTRIVQ